MPLHPRCVAGVVPDDLLVWFAASYSFYFEGLLQVREIYESAIEAEEPYGLPDEDCKKLCLK